MRRRLLEHARRYPRWTAQDVCKLLHQAALGSEHAVADEARVQAWLERELAEMGPGPDEPLLDPLSPRGRVARVHLRPLLALGLDVNILQRAFILTARTFPRSAACFDAYAASALRLAQAGGLGVDAAELADILRQMRQAGLPAVHHSPAFEQNYRPAYRVVDLRLLPAAWADLQKAQR